MNQPEQLLQSVGLSVAVTIFSALVLNITDWGLAPLPWAGLLCGVTLVASMVAARRRPSGRTAAPPLRLPDLGARGGALVGLAVVITAGAMWVAQLPTPQEATQGYTMLWAAPRPGQAANHLEVGVQSMEPQPVAYHLRIVAAEQELQNFAISLEPVQTWQIEVELPDEQSLTIEAQLSRDDTPDVIYRRTVLRAGS